ncbi:hypothetical protein [Candidatus Sulfurimonas baltica]|uniref:Uncharacterized protein n=1 Tax=Candidatus Sulfurimonas baltica TaxID=2740404 RepID=A0A7S7LXJ5_9BACT|nr:hypothetical protein [Candidatus Sulfurimonas baltica]QOY53197.1 hypothetical protein HUE88_05830 [Candidatus Sulfurimonas baltica]
MKTCKYPELINLEIDLDKQIANLIEGINYSIVNLNVRESAKTNDMLSRATKHCKYLIENIDFQLQHLSNFDTREIYYAKIILNMENRNIKDPLFVATKDFPWLVTLPAFKDYYQKYKRCKKHLYKKFDLVIDEQKRRRGYIDTELDNSIKIKMLKTSIDTIKSKISKIKKHKKLKTSLAYMLDEDVENLYEIIKKTNLNYTNTSQTRYLMFEYIVLAPFRIDRKKQHKLYKQAKKEFIIRKFENIRLYEHFLEVNEQNALRYIATLYHEYLALDYEKIRELFIYLFSDNMTKTTNMLNDFFNYREHSIHGRKIDRREFLPNPPPEFEIICDFSSK